MVTNEKSSIILFPNTTLATTMGFLLSRSGYLKKIINDFFQAIKSISNSVAEKIHLPYSNNRKTYAEFKWTTQTQIKIQTTEIQVKKQFLEDCKLYYIVFEMQRHKSHANTAIRSNFWGSLAW